MASRIVHICDWLPPDFGAVGQYTLGFARARAERGADAVVIGLSSAAASETRERLGTGRLTVRRVRAAPYDNKRFLKRLAWTLATNLRLLRAAAPFARDATEVRFTGSPPFLLWLLVPLNLVWRRRLVYRITDFWPECLMAAQARVPAWLHLFWRLTCLLRRRVDAFEVLGEDQRRRLDAIGIPPERIALVRDPSPVAITGSEPPLAVPDALTGHVVLLYSGNWGVAHDVDTFVEAFILHHRADSGRVGLWLNAVGRGADEVERRLGALGLPLARTQPVPLADLPRLMVTADAHLITLKDAFVGYVLPSKVYACLASRRPVLFIGSAESDVHRLCAAREPTDGYLRAAVGDVASVRTALEHLADAAERRAPAPAAAPGAVGAAAVRPEPATALERRRSG